MLPKTWFICLALILTACQGDALFHFNPTPTPFPEKYSGEIQAGSFKLTMSCEGTGEPTIILENGLDYESWGSDSLHWFKSITRTCRYLRAGMNGEMIAGPRTTMDQVKDLHSLLTQSGVPGPYILVGHSIAGYNLVLYTDQYPKEVAGLVCADCRYSAFYQIYMKKLGSIGGNNKDVIDEQNLSTQLLDNWTQYKEQLDIRASDQQVLKVTSLGDRPFIALVGGATGNQFGDLVIRKVFNEAWLEASQQMSELSTRGKVELVPDANHSSILYNQRVYTAIREVFTAVVAGK